MEKWRDIRGYEGLYQVSSLGRVKSLDAEKMGHRSIYIKKGRVLLPNIVKGYCQVSLTVGSVAKYFKIHRLVALHFIDNPKNKPQVNHKNGIKTDNSRNNLEWCTGSENMIHAFEIGLKKGRRVKIAKHSLDGEFIEAYESIAFIEDNFGFNKSAISSVCTGRRKSAYGYQWKYYINELNIPPVLIRKRKVDMFNLEGSFIKRYNSIAEASKKENIDDSSITRACKGIQSRAGSFLWKYSQ